MKTKQNSSGSSPAIVTLKHLFSVAILTSILALNSPGQSVSPLQDTIEQPVKISGEFSMLFEDSAPKSILRYFLKVNGKQHSLHFTGEPPTKFKTGDQVTVSGVQLSSQLLVDSITSAASTSSVVAPQMVSNNSFWRAQSPGRG